MSLRELSERMKNWRCERPDEWMMDEFIRMAQALEHKSERDTEELETLRARVAELEAALSAPATPAAEVAVPDGWVLVPKEPTQRMLEVMHLRYWRGTATGETVSAHWKDCSAPLWKETYREMLSAAQAKGEKP